jgi:hypothetical protein
MTLSDAIKKDKKINKWSHVWVIQGNYGGGWEDVTEEDDRFEARARLKEYDANESYPHRKILRRIKNPLWSE